MEAPTERQARFDIRDEARLPRTVWSLAWPVVLEQSCYTLAGLINTFLVGHLGATSIAAVGLAEQAVYFPMIFFAAVGVGMTAVLARHVGAREYKTANVTLRQSMILAGVLGLTFMAMPWIFAEQIMQILQARPEVVTLGSVYMRAVSCSLLPYMFL